MSPRASFAFSVSFLLSTAAWKASGPIPYHLLTRAAGTGGLLVGVELNTSTKPYIAPDMTYTPFT